MSPGLMFWEGASGEREITLLEEFLAKTLVLSHTHDVIATWTADSRLLAFYYCINCALRTKIISRCEEIFCRHMLIN